MSFRTDCPDSYQPAGFRDAETHSIAADDWNSLWTTPSATVTSFEAPRHVVKISARNKEYEDQSTSQLHDTLMSKQLHNMQRTSSRNAALRSTMPVPATPNRDAQGAENLQSKRVRDEVASQAHAEGSVRASEAKPSPRRRKVSISGRFVQIDRSSPTSVASLDDGSYCETGWSENDFN